MNVKSSVKAASGIALLVAAAAANALTVYEFTTSDKWGTGSFGTVTLSQDGADVDFEVKLVAGAKFVATGAGQDNIFLFNASGVSTADVQNISNGTTLSFKAVTPGDSGLFGTFGFGIQCDPTVSCFGGDDATLSPLTFTVVGAVESDFANLFSSKGGAMFAADILYQGTTGPVGVTAAPIPEPETYALMLAGLGAVGFMARRRKAAQKA